MTSHRSAVEAGTDRVGGPDRAPRTTGAAGRLDRPVVDQVQDPGEDHARHRTARIMPGRARHPTGHDRRAVGRIPDHEARAHMTARPMTAGRRRRVPVRPRVRRDPVDSAPPVRPRAHLGRADTAPPAHVRTDLDRDHPAAAPGRTVAARPGTDHGMARRVDRSTEGRPVRTVVQADTALPVHLGDPADPARAQVARQDAGVPRDRAPVGRSARRRGRHTHRPPCRRPTSSAMTRN
jgi:hypothetical protein